MEQSFRVGKLAGLVMAIALRAAGADAAVIVNSGSTNAAGFRIAVERTGRAEYTTTRRRPSPDGNEKPEPARRHVSDALVQRLFSDLEAAQPLASLSAPRCAKSASFGTRLTIEFGESETPDLSCGDGGNPKLRALIRDSKEIAALFTAK